MILLGPGSTVSHDALRLLAHARTALAAVGEDGVRLYTAAAYVLFHDIVDGYTDRRKETSQEAFELAEKAVTVDDQDAFAHFVLGRVCSIRMEYERAISELETAIELNPSLADAYHGVGFTLTYSGRAEEAIPMFETAYRLSPHDAKVWAFFAIRAIAYIDLRQYDKAIQFAREAIRKPHAKFWAFAHLASALGHGGTPEEAETAVAELLARKPDFTLGFARDHMIWHQQRDHFLEGLRRAGMPEA